MDFPPSLFCTDLTGFAIANRMHDNDIKNKLDLYNWSHYELYNKYLDVNKNNQRLSICNNRKA